MRRRAGVLIGSSTRSGGVRPPLRWIVAIATLIDPVVSIASAPARSHPAVAQERARRLLRRCLCTLGAPRSSERAIQRDGRKSTPGCVCDEPIPTVAPKRTHCGGGARHNQRGPAGIWAGRTVLAPPVDPFTVESPALYQVVEGDIGRTLPTTVLAQWDLVVAAVAPTDGVVTTVEISPGDTLDVGDTIATVDLRPVILAEGDIPAFRAMTPGDVGEDIANSSACFRRSVSMHPQVVATTTRR